MDGPGRSHTAGISPHAPDCLLETSCFAIESDRLHHKA